MSASSLTPQFPNAGPPASGAADLFTPTPAPPVTNPVPTGPGPAERGGVTATVVLPCFNEQDHVLAELERITGALDASRISYEILAIDDASSDGTLAVLQEAATRMPHVQVLHFRRNG